MRRGEQIDYLPHPHYDLHEDLRHQRQHRPAHNGRSRSDYPQQRTGLREGLPHCKEFVETGRCSFIDRGCAFFHEGTDCIPFFKSERCTFFGGPDLCKYKHRSRHYNGEVRPPPQEELPDLRETLHQDVHFLPDNGNVGNRFSVSRVPDHKGGDKRRVREEDRRKSEPFLHTVSNEHYDKNAQKRKQRYSGDLPERVVGESTATTTSKTKVKRNSQWNDRDDADNISVVIEVNTGSHHNDHHRTLTDSTSNDPYKSTVETDWNHLDNRNHHHHGESNKRSVIASPRKVEPIETTTRNVQRTPKTTNARSPAGLSTSLPALPEGWKETTSSSGLPYYYHVTTGERTWERPTAASVAGGNTALTARKRPSEKGRDGDNGEGLEKLERKDRIDTHSKASLRIDSHNRDIGKDRKQPNAGGNIRYPYLPETAHSQSREAVRDALRVPLLGPPSSTHHLSLQPNYRKRSNNAAEAFDLLDPSNTNNNNTANNVFSPSLVYNPVGLPMFPFAGPPGGSAVPNNSNKRFKSDYHEREGGTIVVDPASSFLSDYRSSSLVPSSLMGSRNSDAREREGLLEKEILKGRERDLQLAAMERNRSGTSNRSLRDMHDVGGNSSARVNNGNSGIGGGIGDVILREDGQRFFAHASAADSAALDLLVVHPTPPLPLPVVSSRGIVNDDGHLNVFSYHLPHPHPHHPERIISPHPQMLSNQRRQQQQQQQQQQRQQHQLPSHYPHHYGNHQQHQNKQQQQTQQHRPKQQQPLRQHQQQPRQQPHQKQHHHQQQQNDQRHQSPQTQNNSNYNRQGARDTSQHNQQPSSSSDHPKQYNHPQQKQQSELQRSNNANNNNNTLPKEEKEITRAAPAEMLTEDEVFENGCGTDYDDPSSQYIDDKTNNNNNNNTECVDEDDDDDEFDSFDREAQSTLSDGDDHTEDQSDLSDSNDDLVLDDEVHRKLTDTNCTLVLHEYTKLRTRGRPGDMNDDEGNSSFLCTSGGNRIDGKRGERKVTSVLQDWTRKHQPAPHLRDCLLLGFFDYCEPGESATFPPISNTTNTSSHNNNSQLSSSSSTTTNTTNKKKPSDATSQSFYELILRDFVNSQGTKKEEEGREETTVVVEGSLKEEVVLVPKTCEKTTRKLSDPILMTEQIATGSETE